MQTYSPLGTVQFIFVATKPDTFADLQALIPQRSGIGNLGPLGSIGYPIVLRENGDWAEYVDEYDGYGGPNAPSWPGIAIIDQMGKFYAVRAYPGASYNIHQDVDWVVRTIDELLGDRQPVNTVLALDRSGSMNAPPPSGGMVPKIDILKDAVGVFFDVWEANAISGDRVGIVDFSDAVTQYTQLGTGETLVPLATNSTLVCSYVNNLSAGGLTCIGGAVALALDELSDSGRRHIILFSDGMQNCNPVLADVGYNQIEILQVDPADVDNYELVTGIYCNSGIPPKPGQRLQDFDTHIHTIGVGLSGPPWSDLMSQVASQTSGMYFETPKPEVDLQNFYINALLESFKGATPQLAQHSQGTYNPEEGCGQDSCSINSTARWLTVVLTWQGNPDHDRLLCNLEAPGGTLIEIHSRTKTAPRRRVISMPLPTFHYDRLVNHAGQWHLHVMGTSSGPVPYQVFWIVDDQHVHFEIGKIDQLYYVGDTLKLKARLLQDGKSLPAARIQETMVKMASPRVDLGAFVQGYQVVPATLRRLKKDVKTLQHASETELKLYILSQDKQAVANLTKMHFQTLQMEYKKAELLGAVKFARPGLHRFDIKVKALDHKGHLIVRQRTVNVCVRSGKKIRKASQ